MGQTGSLTSKAKVLPCLQVYTTWSREEMSGLLTRCQRELGETFALRQVEFEFLVGRELVPFSASRMQFVDVLDTDKNGLVDKLEVMLLVTLLSSLANAAKVTFMFELFNFNNKGYLIRSELSLLLHSISRVAVKADPTLGPAPSYSLLQDLVQIAFEHFCRIDPAGVALRKPELVSFAAEVVHVQTYLDAWRGHASQVLLPKEEKWRDAFFPCNETALAPSRDWTGQQGAPPGEFCYWRRKELVGNMDKNDLASGCRVLFAHKTRAIKSVDKRVCYEGPGVLGNGLLAQGMLADRWILNGLAACLSRPRLLANSLFAPTEQEHDKGRFCVRLYEGGSWRSVFVDDRIPCAPDFCPLFAHSSDSSECWPLLFEKALAKYLGGSYAHVGMCSLRPDAVTMGLRLLSGGHCFKVPTADWKWESAGSHLPDPALDGGLFLHLMRGEGSIVAFGRSEALSMHHSTLQHSPRLDWPHGFLFPVVLTGQRDDGYKYVVVRDAFGHLVPPTDPYSTPGDEASGHCRIHHLQLEDVPLMFDTLFVCRFPDATRVGADREGFPQWKTRVCKAQSKGQRNPAKFLLTVSDPPPPPPLQPKEAALRLSKMREKVAGMTAGDSDVVTQGMINRFNYDRPRMVPGEIGTAIKQEPTQEDLDRLERLRKEEQNVPASVALTVASSCDWFVAGSPEAGAKIRVRVVPSIKTLKMLRLRKAQQEAKEEAKRLAQLEYKRRQMELLAAKEHDEPPPEEAGAAVEAEAEAEAKAEIEAEVKIDKGKQDDPTAAAAAAAAASVPPKKKITFAQKEAILKEEFFEVRCSANTSWLSQSLSLWPGDYYVSVDVSFAMPHDRRLALTTPLSPTEAPWLDNRPHEVDSVWCQVSSAGAFALDALSAEQCPKYASSVASIAVRPEKFPFSFETPAEASSRGLDAMLSRLKSETVMLDADYVATRMKLKKLYKTAKRAELL